MNPNNFRDREHIDSEFTPSAYIEPQQQVYRQQNQSRETQRMNREMERHLRIDNNQGSSRKTIIIVVIACFIVVGAAICATIYFTNKKSDIEEKEIVLSDDTRVVTNQQPGYVHAKFPGETDGGDWRFESFDWLSNRRVTSDEIHDLSPYRLRLLRNAIFAMHNYSFKSADLRDYFGRFNWYSPDYADVTSMLSPIELDNISLIKRYE